MLTFETRRLLKEAVSARYRALLGPECLDCGGLLSGTQRMYCCTRCRKRHWRQTMDKGRAWCERNNAKRNERRKAAA